MARWSIRWETLAGPVTRPIPDARPLVLGRDPACDVVFDDGTVSRRHCELFVRDGRAWLRHLSASNPTYLNGRIALGETALAAGDVLAIPVLAVEVVATDG
jgi:pSer/pThr/pTyr-binding forkhead associated (FHA) protein